MRSCATRSTNLNGPAQTGCVLKSPAACAAFGDTIMPARSVSCASSGANGADSTSLTVWSSMMSTAVTALISALRFEPGNFRWRSMLNLTGAASASIAESANPMPASNSVFISAPVQHSCRRPLNGCTGPNSSNLPTERRGECSASTVSSAKSRDPCLGLVVWRKNASGFRRDDGLRFGIGACPRLPFNPDGRRTLPDGRTSCDEPEPVFRYLRVPDAAELGRGDLLAAGIGKRRHRRLRLAHDLRPAQLGASRQLGHPPADRVHVVAAEPVET